MSLITSLLNPGPAIYYDPDFRNVFEDHLNFILNTKQASIEMQTVDENTGARFAGDWRGLMLAMGQVPHMAWFNLRLNGLISTTDYDGKLLNIRILNIVEVEKLATQYKTRKKN